MKRSAECSDRESEESEGDEVLHIHHWDKEARHIQLWLREGILRRRKSPVLKSGLLAGGAVASNLFALSVR